MNYQVNIGGQISPVSGTSASAPLFASIVALLNDRLIAQGQSTLGFLNPFLYTMGRVALDDVSVGNNPGCGTDGFPATPGWDPVRASALGTQPVLLTSCVLSIRSPVWARPTSRGS